jgi:hypothetical protein
MGFVNKRAHKMLCQRRTNVRLHADDGKHFLGCAAAPAEA